jgi:hypothetical protein
VCAGRQWSQKKRSQSCDRVIIKRDVAILSGMEGCARSERGGKSTMSVG